MECYMGTIFPWAPNFSPYYFSYCNGVFLEISQYNALFALLGNRWGGDGIRTFALPDLRKRMPLGNALDFRAPVLGESGGAATVTLTAENLPSHTHDAIFTPVRNTTTVTTPSVAPKGNLATTVATEIVGGDTTAQDPAAGGSYYLTGVKGASLGPVTTTPPTAATKANLLGTTVTVTPSADYVPYIPSLTAEIPTVVDGQVTIRDKVKAATPVGILPPYLVVNYIICTEGIYPWHY